MWKIHRYYFKEVLTNASLTFLVLFGIALISLIYRGIQRAQGGDLLDAALVTLFWAADTFPHLLAISLLFGTVLTFARASSDRELTAIRAAGVPPRVPLAAALLVGMLFSIVGAWTLHYVLPWAHFYKFRVVEDVARNLIMNTRVAGDVIQLPPGVMTWDHEDERGHFHDVVMNLTKREGGKQQPIGDLLVAAEAWFELDARNDELILRFRDLHNPMAERTFDLQKTGIRFNLHDITDEGYRNEGDKDLSSDQLLAEVYRGVHENPQGVYYTVHYRGAFALLPLLFAPFGFAIGALSQNRGRATALALAMVPILIYYVGHFLAPELARLVGSPLLAWFPIVLLGVCGLLFSWRWRLR